MNANIDRNSLTSTRRERARTCALAGAAVVPCALAALWFAAPNFCQNALRSRSDASEEYAQKANALEFDAAQKTPKDDWRAKLDALYPDENFVERRDFPAPPAPNLDDDYDLAAKMEEFEPSAEFGSDGAFAQDALPQAPLAEQIALRDEYAPEFTTSVLDDLDSPPLETAVAQDDYAPDAENVESEASPFAPVSEEDVFGDLFAGTPSPNAGLDADFAAAPNDVAENESDDVPLVAAAPVDEPLESVESDDAFTSPLANDFLPPPNDDLDALPSAPNQFPPTAPKTLPEGCDDAILTVSNDVQPAPASAAEAEPSPEVDSFATLPPAPSVELASSAYLDAVPKVVEEPAAQPVAAPNQGTFDFAQEDVAHEFGAAPEIEPFPKTGDAFDVDANLETGAEVAPAPASLTDAERDAARRIAAYDQIAATEPSYFSRALDLYGGENAFSQLNFARAARIIDERAAFNPRAISSAFDYAGDAADETVYPPELAFNPEADAPKIDAAQAPASASAPASTPPSSPVNAAPSDETAPALAPETTREGAQVARPNKVALVGYEEKAETPPRAAGVGYIAKPTSRRDANPLAELEGELGALGLVGARVERWDAGRWRASGARMRDANGGLEFRQGFGATPREATDVLKNDLANYNGHE